MGGSNLGDVLRRELRRCRNCGRVGANGIRCGPTMGTIWKTRWNVTRTLGGIAFGVCSQQRNDRLIDRQNQRYGL